MDNGIDQGIADRDVVLIGGAGFIGHHLALQLADRGARVSVIDDLRTNHLKDFATRRDLPQQHLYMAMLQHRLRLLECKQVRLYERTAHDRDAVKEVLDGTEAPLIVHLAGVSHADRANADPSPAVANGLATLAVALDLARDKAERFVFVSSSMVYGDFETTEVTEEHPMHPVNVYGALKACGENMVKAFHRAYGLTYSIVRPAALYGPRCVSRRVVQTFIECAMCGEPLRLEGDGEERIDFTYVDDLVDGMCRVLALPAARNEVFNLTCGNARSLRELATIVVKEFPGTRTSFTQRDRSRPRRGTLRVDKARSLLGYFPRTQLEDGVPRYAASITEENQALTTSMA